MTDLTPERRAEIRKQARQDMHFKEFAQRPNPIGGTLVWDWFDASKLINDLLDAADFLDEVRDQVRRGALCPMCSTGMTRQTVGMICQLCGTNYGEENDRD